MNQQNQKDQKNPKAPETTAAPQEKKNSGRPRRFTSKSRAAKAPKADFKIGSHDILATPEILSPAADSASEAPAAKKSAPKHNRRSPAKAKAEPKAEPKTTESAADSAEKKPASMKPASMKPAPRKSAPRKRGKTEETKAVLEAMTDAVAAEAAPAKSEKPAAPTHNRKNTTRSGAKSTAKKSAKTDSAKDSVKEETAKTEKPADKSTAKPAAKTASKSKGRSRGPSIVSAEDSIVVDAEVLPPKHVRKTPSPVKLEPIPGAKIRIIPLGGLNEVGKNMTVVEYGDDIIVVDCGIGFPDEDEMPGIDLVIPDITYLEKNRDRVRGIVLTHGHEDHIGAIPYILQKICPPIYGTRLTLGIIENKLQEHKLPWKADLRCVKAGDTVKLGSSFTCEFIHVNHSIADACALAINTPLGMLVHTGDFKLDLTPIEGEMTDLTRLGELGREGVLLLMCESTNAERPGFTPSEKKVGKSLEMIFTMNTDCRIVIATFSSNVHRVQQIINISARHGRKVAVTGRSMINIVSAAVELGYMTVPEGVLIDINDMKRYKPEELTLITTGSQGEPMSALYRMAFGDHSQVTLGQGDLVVLSASAIPGNEKLVNRIVNELSKMGVRVLNDSAVEVHVSGHACQEELKLMQGLIKPHYFMPVHGEYKHMAANRELAMSMGIPSERTFISEIGKVLEIDEKGARFAGTVPAGIVLVDGYGVGDVGNIVLRDRKHLSQDGLIVVVATVDANAGLLVSGPDIVSRGFVYVRESEELMEEVRRIASEAITNCLDRSGCDWYEIKNCVKDDITRFLYSRTKRKPMILPIVMDV